MGTRAEEQFATRHTMPPLGFHQVACDAVDGMRRVDRMREVTCCWARRDVRFAVQPFRFCQWPRRASFGKIFGLHTLSSAALRLPLTKLLDVEEHALADQLDWN